MIHLTRRKKPEGYKELLVYQRAVQLHDFVYEITENFPPNERRRREHMRDGELKEDGEDCIKRSLINQKTFEELMKKCGEIDFLMGRLKNALERKIEKEDVLSPYDRWLKKQWDQRREEEGEFDEELKKIVEKAKREKGAKGERGEKSS